MTESSYVNKLVVLLLPCHASPSVSMAPSVICVYFRLDL